MCDSWDRAVGQWVSQGHSDTWKTVPDLTSGPSGGRPLGNSWATVVRQSTVAADSFFRRITFQILQHRCPVPTVVDLGNPQRRHFPSNALEAAEDSPWEASRLPDLRNGQWTP